MEKFSYESFTAMLDSLGSLGVVWTIVIGLIVGTVAKFIMPGRDPGGIIVTTLLGIGGSALATYIGDQFGITIAGQFSGFIAAVLGAMLILFVYRLIFRRPGPQD